MYLLSNMAMLGIHVSFSWGQYQQLLFTQQKSSSLRTNHPDQTLQLNAARPLLPGSDQRVTRREWKKIHGSKVDSLTGRWAPRIGIKRSDLGALINLGEITLLIRRFVFETWNCFFFWIGSHGYSSRLQSPGFGTFSKHRSQANPREVIWKSVKTIKWDHKNWWCSIPYRIHAWFMSKWFLFDDLSL